MAKDVSETVRDALASVAREALKNAGSVTPGKKKSGPLSGAKGVAVGAGLAALAPLAARKGIEAVRGNGGPPRASVMFCRCRCAHASNSSGGTARTTARMSAWLAPHSSAHCPL